MIPMINQQLPTAAEGQNSFKKNAQHMMLIPKIAPDSFMPSARNDLIFQRREIMEGAS